ncbi:hypothetical protein ACFB49_20090 [Sphingomonas sp. DBB INV C78]|uniref:hypothetical protein n=1 Tax=Sphingomonas sp. DBB INV C78 TaxID=3349434 RepID=UPI0036D2A504
MRVTASIMFAIAACGLVAGCDGKGTEEGGFSASFKKSFHEKFVSSCVEGAVKAAPAGTAVDFKPLCTCTADKLTQDAGVTDLVSIPDEKMDAVMKQCVAQLYPKGIPGAPGGPPAEGTAP